MRPPFTQRPSTTTTQTIQVSSSILGNILRVLIKKSLQVTATAVAGDNEVTGPPFTQHAASSATKCTFEDDIISDSEPGTPSDNDIMVADVPKVATSKDKASHKAPHVTASVSLVRAYNACS